MDFRKVFILMFCMIFMISMVSAFDFDNVVKYKNEDMTVELVNCDFWLGICLNEGEILGEVNLKSHGSVNEIKHVGLGDQVTMWYESPSWDKLGLGEVEFIDRKTGEIITKDYTYVYWGEVEFEVGDFEKVGEDFIKIGSHIENREDWLELDLSNIPKGKLMIGIKTFVEVGDYVDGVWEILGKKIKKHAEWTADLSVGVQLYHDFEDNIEDVTGIYNLTVNNGQGNFVSGVVGNAINVTDATNMLVSNTAGKDWASLNTTATYIFWINQRQDLTNQQTIFDKHWAFSFQDSNQYGWNLYESGAFNPQKDPINDVWVMVTLMYNSTGYFVYFNGTYNSGGAYSPIPASTEVLGLAVSRINNQGASIFMDELLIYNRTLNPTEMVAIYNANLDGNGYTTNFNDAPNVTLNSPVDYLNSTSQSINFNWTAEDNVQIDNSTLFIDGAVNQTITHGTSNSTNEQVSLTFADGDYNWTITASDDVGEVGTTDTRFFTIDTIDPVIVAIQNLTNQTTFSLPMNSTWIMNVSDVNLGSCWYNTTDNATITIVTCNASIKTLWTTEGEKTVYYYVNDTFGHETSGSKLINIALISATSSHAPDVTTEGGSVNLDLYVNKTSITTTTAYLYFNNTIYTPTSSASANYYYFNYTFNVPDGWGNTTGKGYNYYWNYTIDGITSNESTDIDNFTIYEITFDDCSTFGEIILNMSLFDEESNDYVNATAGANIEVDLTLTSIDSNLSWNFSNTWLNNASGSESLDALVCLPYEILNSTNFTIDYTAGFSSTDHVWEFYYLDNGTLTFDSEALNSITDKNIYLMNLLTADSTSFLFNYFDADGLPVKDSIVHVFRKYIGEGTFREVERAKQDDNADTIIHLVEEDVIYQFIISLQGTILYTSSTYTALCQAVPCTLQLEESGGFQEFDTTNWDLIEGGSYLITSSSSTRVVNLTYTLDAPAEMNLTVYSLEGDGSYNIIDSEASTSTSGSLLISVPTISGNTSFFASVYQNDIFKKSEWVDFESDAGVYFGNTLSLFLGALIILTLGLMAVSEGVGVIVFLIVGMIIAMALGVVDYRTSTGANMLIYVIIAGALLLWKLTRRNR